MLDVPVWALDRPLTYGVPEALAPVVHPGTIVRVPLRGRRVRGWVLSVSEAPQGTRVGEGLQPVAAVSGPAPVFDAALLAAARCLARRYVHPLSAFLRLITPPQMGRRGRSVAPEALAGGPGTGAGARSGGGSASRTLLRLAPRDDPAARYAEAISGVLAGGGVAIVAVPEVRAGSVVLERLKQIFGDEAAVVHSGQDPAPRSRALWSVARGERRVILGGRAAVLAPASPAPLGLIVVHGEADRTLKEQRSPYYDAREGALARAEAAGAGVILAAEGPSLRSLARATGGAESWTVTEPSRSAMRAGWPVVELVEPTRSVMPRRAVAAILAAWRAGSRVLVLVPRVRATPSGPGPAEVAAYLRRAAPGARVERADPVALGEDGNLEAALAGQIVVATETALAGAPVAGTAVALGVDAMIHRPTGRAAEEAFVTLWELAGVLARSASPARLLLETATAGHHAVQAVVRGDYHFFAHHELEDRRASDVPPYTTLVRVRVTGPPDSRPGSRPGSRSEPGMGEEVLEALAALPSTELLGPVEGRLGTEVLLKAKDREKILDPLRKVVSSSAEHLLVEMDPREW